MERKIIVRVRDGLHARPATRFVKLAKSFACDIEITKGAKTASAKSAVKLMLLSVMENDEVDLKTTGEDEATALEQLANYLQDPQAGLDDGESQAVAPAGLKAVAASEGIGLGPVFAYFPEPIAPDNRVISAAEQAEEVHKLNVAVVTVRQRMKRGAEDKSLSPADRAIIAALSEIAGDEAMQSEMAEAIAGGASALNAILQVSSRTADEFSKMGDTYLKARADDIRSVARQIALAVQGKVDADLSNIPFGSIIVADDVGAFEFTRAPLKKIAGLVCAKGSTTSHIAIIARTHGIPAILGLGEGIEKLRNAKYLAMDGKTGQLIPEPDAATKAEFEQRQKQAQSEREALKAYLSFYPTKKDGTKIEVAANIGSADEIDVALAAGAMGVGLFRTELLFMQHRELPSEEIQFAVYSKIAEAFKPHSVIVRTLDIGGDKPVAGIEFPYEENPFLGWRGVRMCLDRPDVFKPQLRALLRAAIHGNIKVMVPMIVDAGEVRAVKALIKICADELRAEGQAFAAFPLGVMIETPAAVFAADELAKESAFFSIGTNDLTQYVMAADRLNAKLAKLYDVTHPAVMRAIAMTVEAGRKAGIMVGMCGEAASRVDLIPKFIDMGLTELSMSPASIPRAKATLAKLFESDIEL